MLWILVQFRNNESNKHAALLAHWAWALSTKTCRFLLEKVGCSFNKIVNSKDFFKK